MGLNFKKTIKIGKDIVINFNKNNGISISKDAKHSKFKKNKKNDIKYTIRSSGAKNSKFGENVIDARKGHILLMIAICILLFLGLVNPIFLIITIIPILYMFISKHGRQRMYISASIHSLQISKIDKAEKYLKKAKKTLDNELIFELEEDINNIKNRNSNKKKSLVLEYKDILLNKQIERNFKAVEFENKGDINSAIDLYELNIKEGFTGIVPYERLMELYEKQQKYDDEIRVIGKAIEIFKNSWKYKTDKQSEIEMFTLRLEKIKILKEKLY
ncbi:hypothetical protein [Clostridium scatologenes]|uniref:TPR repeat-containing protein n=1 Tax=Clostridium scatologenes TaxID=1548 RepID=A0A0E3JY60_CLOSL|nr:hypothetical protein [Clostridium scatologenes]AKA68605.1 hypothetical protein CSCA_1480 [Clostridium scatologenes]